MKHRLTLSLFAALVATSTVAWSGPPAAQQRTEETTPNIASMVHVDEIKALRNQLAQLKDQLATLKQANDALTTRVQAMDAGLGQVVTQNVSQAKQINDLSTKLANHHHAYTYNRVGWSNEYFVTESGGIAKMDKTSLASYINGEDQVAGTTGPAQ